MKATCVHDASDVASRPNALSQRPARASNRTGSTCNGGGRQRILFVTSEMADYIKVGGLGDVSAALPRALRRRHDVRVLIPGYRDLIADLGEIPVVGRLGPLSSLPACDVGKIETLDGLIVYVLLCPELYDRDGSPHTDASGTDWANNDIRFGRLGLAAADIACGLGDPMWMPDLIHLNDWPTALAPAYLA